MPNSWNAFEYAHLPVLWQSFFSTGWARLTAAMKSAFDGVLWKRLCFCCFDCGKEIEPCGAKWWTLGAALISAGRILAASIIVVRTMIVGFWRGGVKGRSFGLSLDRCWGDTQ